MDFLSKPFIHDDFMLTNEFARELYHESGKDMPIIDYHCHLDPKMIADNYQFKDLTEVWLGGDHYKWRALRGNGVPEEFITGSRDSYEKFEKWAETVPYTMRNPLYHWTHLELARAFGIYDILNPSSARAIYEECTAKLQTEEYRGQALMRKFNVSVVCTTDDPADSLEYHILLAKENGFKCKVLPAFRPDKALGIDLPSWRGWLEAMENCVGRKINGFEALCDALNERIEFFATLGCCASDHAFAYVPYETATAEELDAIFVKVKNGGEASIIEADKFKTALLAFLAEKYADKGWGMELHIGPMRNNNTLMFNRIGPDAGFDSIDDREIAGKLSRFLDSLAVKEKLPKTVLFTLNPKDNYVLGTMLGNFQNSDAESKIQFGSAWWFNDNIDGMREQMKALGNLGALGKFVGMVTDSRSFLSYPRHEYFRRIMCGLLGDMVENGLYPFDEKAICKIAEDISYNNAAKYFGIK